MHIFNYGAALSMSTSLLVEGVLILLKLICRMFFTTVFTIYKTSHIVFILQCFDAVRWMAGRASGL